MKDTMKLLNGVLNIILYFVIIAVLISCLRKVIWDEPNVTHLHFNVMGSGNVKWVKQ